jgi:hypothetical protein
MVSKTYLELHFQKDFLKLSYKYNTRMKRKTGTRDTEKIYTAEFPSRITCTGTPSGKGGATVSFL